MEFLKILSSGAAGALLVLIIQIYTDRRKQKYERRYRILCSLMANFQNVVSYDFVSALNLILIEYDEKSEVRKWHTKFMEHVCTPAAQDDVSMVARNKSFNNILIKIVEEIGKSINIKIEQLDISNKIYWPQGFIDSAATQQKLIGLLIETQEQWREILSQVKNSNIDIKVSKKIKKGS